MSSEETPTQSRVGPLTEPVSSGGRFAPGTLIAKRYQIVSLLGRGGMGEVYRAEDVKLRQSLAIKLLPPLLAADPKRLARFQSEVRVARQVSHPNVCRVHDIGEADGLHFLSMELVDGEDLTSLIRRIGRLPRDKGLEIARQMCAGLAAVHAQGILHRDLKPANVMLDGRGRVRLTDFGLAVPEQEGGVDAGGTPAYMAPERLAGQPATVRTDVYALGLVMYEIFTGRPAFRAESVSELLRLQRDVVIEKPSLLVSEIDVLLERVILGCLDRDPLRRPASALAVLAALPGGDPLAVALEAGETPAPELVADAGDAGALRPGTAWTCAALIAAAFPFVLWLESPFMILGRVNLDKPPAVLAERARQVLARLGVATEAAFSASGFSYDGALVRFVDKELSPERWDPLRDGRPAAIRFWYRISPEPIVARPWTPLVREDDPPMVEPGAATVWLDPRGRLVEFRAVPAEHGAPVQAAGAPDWEPLLEEAGLDRSGLEPGAPNFTPPVYADTRATWNGRFETRAEWPLRLEAAALAGRVVWARLEGPWNDDFDRSSRVPARGLILGIWYLGTLALGLFFAYRNLRLDRADRRGAFRLASVAFGATLLVWALEADHAATLLGEWPLLAAGVGVAAWNALLPWILYLAIEPFVRRHWPDSLISWSRLMAGRFRDPRVGRDVLIGLTFTLSVPVFIIGARLAQVTWGHSLPPPALIDLDHLSSVRFAVAWLAFAPVRAFWTCLIPLVVLLALRVVFRRHWVAFLGYVSVFALAVTAWLDVTGWPELLAQAFVAGLMFALVTRFGILALFVPGLFMDPRFPVTTHVTAWYGQSTLLLVVAVAALTVYGLLVSVGRRPLLGEAALDG